jgi:hypothetical protein
MPGMIGDLYRKFDRLKIMSESYSDEDVKNKEKEITDQFYDIISYCQLQLYWLRREKWGKKAENVQSREWKTTDSAHFTINADGTKICEMDIKKLVELISDLVE